MKIQSISNIASEILRCALCLFLDMASFNALVLNRLCHLLRRVN